MLNSSKENQKISFKHGILRQVNFRIDYYNVMDADIEYIISNNLRSLYINNGFEKFWNENENSVDIDLPAINSGDDLPKLNNFERLKIWCFYGENEYMKKTIKISKNYFILSLVVKTKYTSFKEYINIILETMQLIKEKVKEQKYRKISMRKINFCIINDLEKISNYFNSNVFDVNNEVVSYGKDDVIDLKNSLLICKNQIYVNYIRNIQKGHNINTNSELYRIVLDLDSYINYDINQKTDEKEFNLKSEIEKINTRLYEIFISGLTEELIDVLIDEKKDDGIRTVY